MGYLRPEDEQAYGPELLDVMRRGARDAVQPELAELYRRQSVLAQREQRLQNQMVLNALDKAMPDWRVTNHDPQFLEFLAQAEELSGRQAHALLLEAFAQGDVARILAFFNAYRAAIGQAPASPAPAPGVGRTQTPGRQTTRQGVSARDIEQLYEKIRKQGRTPALDAEEKALHRALHARQ
jgi:hypothetical protein